jgi:four helix bundle protein
MRWWVARFGESDYNPLGSGCGRALDASMAGAGRWGKRDADQELVKTHEQLEVYRLALGVAMEIFEASKTFPKEEVYSLTDQARRATRSVCANIAEAWRKRRYRGSFLLKLNNAEAESAEAITWIEFAVRCGYLDVEKGNNLKQDCENVIGKLVRMQNNPSGWIRPHTKP